MERTLILLKPDCVQRRLMGRILTRFEDKGFNVVAMKMLRVTPELAKQHYAEHVEKPFYPGLEAFITGSPVLAMIVEGLESENARLRVMLNLAPEAPARFITGRVIGDSGGAFLRSVLINIGARDGVRKGVAAVDGTSLLGRIAEVGNRSSRILLVSDLNSRIPVLVGESRERAILAGDNSDLPKLAYLPVEISIAPGDLVITSGHGGAFPAGLPVGIVVRPDPDSEELRVEPFYSTRRLEFVRLMDFGLTGVLQDRDLASAGR